MIQDSFFNKNNGPSIFSYQSTFMLKGKTVFRDNTADRGGGLALYNSTVTFGPGSNAQFINNKALEYGGAIYVISMSPLPALLNIVLNLPGGFLISLLKEKLLHSSCFYVVDSKAEIYFKGNEAIFGGLDIFGASLYTYSCSLEKEQFKFDNPANRTLLVSSNPSRVCFCDSDTPQCTSTAFLVKNETRYPGEKFSIPVALTGYNFGRVAGTVYTDVVGLDYRDVINETQHAQSANNISSCTNLQYSIISQQNQTSFVVLALTAQEQFTHGIKELKASIPYLTTPVYISFTLEECPLGFMLNKKFGICDCDQTIKDLAREDGTSLTCEIHSRTGYVTRQGKIWFGIGAHLYYKYGNCPRDYCDRAELTIDLREPDTQCRLNRSGVLCGRCQNGYSLQLGNNNCAQCNNKTVVLLIVFAILGILLVALLTVLDLTVASGTINGLIFYANIVWINNAILFPARERLGISYYIITVPIAWINLGFGIETCFSENLDQLAKSGMQFVFPVYIWCIAGLIILICHYTPPEPLDCLETTLLRC